MASSTEKIFALMKSLPFEQSETIRDFLGLLEELHFQHNEDKFKLNSQQNQIEELNRELQKKDELIEELQDNVTQLEEEKTRLETLLAEEADKEKRIFDPEFFEIFDDFEPIENSYQKTLENLFQTKKSEIIELKKTIKIKKSNVRTRDDKINRMRKEIRRLHAQKKLASIEKDQTIAKMKEPSINDWIDQGYYDYYVDQYPEDEQDYVD